MWSKCNRGQHLTVTKLNSVFGLQFGCSYASGTSLSFLEAILGGGLKIEIGFSRALCSWFFARALLKDIGRWKSSRSAGDFHPNTQKVWKKPKHYNKMLFLHLWSTGSPGPGHLIFPWNFEIWPVIFKTREIHRPWPGPMSLLHLVQISCLYYEQ